MLALDIYLLVYFYDYFFYHPHLIAIVLIVNAAPWLIWQRQFSLRTLLVVTTAVAVVLGLVVWGIR
jgi:hypothetical protein